ncbi:hypothetical protein BKH46_08325 [Helicobacter sp. 12S02634-8]|nr:hypothetical protein BKH46_08325 [Helicobacter sp. 12S02634-8]
MLETIVLIIGYITICYLALGLFILGLIWIYCREELKNYNARSYLEHFLTSPVYWVSSIIKGFEK